MEWSHFLVLAAVLALFGLRGFQARTKLRRVRALFAEGTQALGEDRLDAAEAALRKCVRLSPATAPLHRMLGRALAAQGRFVDAATAMGIAAGLEPKNADARLEHGLMLAHCGPEHEEATAQALERALSLKPELRQVLHEASQLEAIRRHPAVVPLLASQK